MYKTQRIWKEKKVLKMMSIECRQYEVVLIVNREWKEMQNKK